jgi:hypothetical protein
MFSKYECVERYVLDHLDELGQIVPEI